jgi:retinol dehydrogenase 12
VRSSEKGDSAIQSIKSRVASASVDYLLMDLTDLKSVVAFATAYKARGNPLNVLVNNAGIMALPFAVTKDGIEEQFQVNHLSHFLLTHHLLSNLVAAKGRVVNLSSRAHMRWNAPLSTDLDFYRKQQFEPWICYGRSKLANILFAVSLASRFPLKDCGVTFNSLHPGVVDTQLLSNANFQFPGALPTGEGAKTSVFLATSPAVAQVTGEYFFECKIENEQKTKWASSVEEADKLWKASMTLCGIETFGKP